MDRLEFVSCGEVLLQNNHDLIVYCSLCETKPFAFHEYADHVQENHCFDKFREEILEDYANKIQNMSPNQCSTVETHGPLVSADDLKMLEELEFVAPEPENCKEIEHFVASFKKKERNENLANQTQDRKLSQKRQRVKKPLRRKYKCERCDFVTLYFSSMRCHIQRHDGLRRFKCPQCDKAFYTQSEVENHKRTHTLERPYLCTTCGHTCITSFALWRHRKSCNNIRDKECLQCHAKFTDSKSLRDHMTAHSNVRSFHCGICTASFKLKKALISHIKIHENKREYKCKICESSFNQAPSLSSHIKNMH